MKTGRQNYIPRAMRRFPAPRGNDQIRGNGVWNGDKASSYVRQTRANQRPVKHRGLHGHRSVERKDGIGMRQDIHEIKAPRQVAPKLLLVKYDARMIGKSVEFLHIKRLVAAAASKIRPDDQTHIAAKLPLIGPFKNARYNIRLIGTIRAPRYVQDIF